MPISNMFASLEEESMTDEEIEEVIGRESSTTMAMALQPEPRADPKPDTKKEVQATTTTRIKVMADTCSCNSACSVKFAQAFDLDDSVPGEDYRAANGSIIRRHGEKVVTGKTAAEGESVNIRFQVAEVSRPLLSIPEITSKGHRAEFHKDHGVIFLKTGQQIKLRREGNAYFLVMDIPASESEAAAGFSWQG